ncbi:MAG: site-2 protease family protein, partial [Pseudomonadota bacterium]
RDGDRVLTIDGAPVETFSGFVDEMLGAAGTPREVTILRDGREETLVFSLIETPRVGRVQPGSAAAVACLEPGDVVMKVEDLPIATFTQLREAIVASEGAPLRLSVARGGDIVETRITPRMTERPNPLTGEVTRVYMIGVAADMQLGFGRSMAPIGFFEAVWFGVERTWLVISSTLGYIGAWIGGEADGSSIGGPLGIAQASGMAASQGVLAFIGLIATLSTAIGFMNLFPIPILDGGHLVLYAIEAIRGRALAEQWMEVGARIGLAALLALLVFATYNDVSKGAVSLSAC